MNQNLATRWLKDLRFYIILSLILWQPDFTNQIDLGKLGSHMFDDSFQIDHLIGTRSRDCHDHQIWSSSGMNQSRAEAVNSSEGAFKAVWRWSEGHLKEVWSRYEGEPKAKNLSEVYLKGPDEERNIEWNITTLAAGSGELNFQD